MSDNFDYREEEANRSLNSRKDLDSFIKRGQMQKIAEEVFFAKNLEFWRNIGIDIKEFKDLNDLRNDLIYLREQKDSTLERKSTIFKSFITAVIGTLLGVIVSIGGWIAAHKF